MSDSVAGIAIATKAATAQTVVIKVKGLNRSPPGDITGVGIAVGYDSPSQFRHEHRRMFGKAPRRDTLRVRGPIDINGRASSR